MDIFAPLRSWSFLQRMNILSNAPLYGVHQQRDALRLSLRGYDIFVPEFACRQVIRNHQQTVQDAHHKELDRLIGNAISKPRSCPRDWQWRRQFCRATLTLSGEQKAVPVKLFSTTRLADNIAVQLCGDRALPMPQEGCHEEVVSIEMFEVV